MLYRTANNAIITLGDTDVSGRGRHFKSRFIQPGVAGYPGQFGNVLITKETLDKFINTMVGVPVIINHKTISQKNADDERVGVVSSVWYDDKDGWYWCDGVIWDKTAQNLITEKGWNVSCSYDVLKAEDDGGSENNIAYDIEFLDGVFTHLAIVNNPRYERANIVFNSKTFNINNFNPNHDEKGRFCEGSNTNNIVDLTNKFTKTPTLTDVKNYVNKIVKNGSKFATLSPDWFVDTKVNSKAKGHIIYSNEWNKMSESERDRHNEYVLELESLLKNAEYINSKDNTKKDIKPKIEKYHYFKTFVRIGKNNYEIIFDTEQYIGESEDKPQTVHLYNVHEINKTPFRAESKNSKNTIGSSKVIINDNSQNFNPNMKQHEVNNEKERDMALIDELKKLINRVENTKEGDEMDNEQKENVAENEKVDKRKLIDEVGGILKGKVDEEVWRTIIGKIEKIGYNESEAGKADNECDKNNEKADNKKVKNESEKDKEKVKELKEDLKKDVNNSKTDYFSRMNEVYNASQQAREEATYVSRADKLKAGEEMFSVKP